MPYEWPEEYESMWTRKNLCRHLYEADFIKRLEFEALRYSVDGISTVLDDDSSTGTLTVFY